MLELIFLILLLLHNYIFTFSAVIISFLKWFLNFIQDRLLTLTLVLHHSVVTNSINVIILSISFLHRALLLLLSVSIDSIAISVIALLLVLMLEQVLLLVLVLVL